MTRRFFLSLFAGTLAAFQFPWRPKTLAVGEVGRFQVIAWRASSKAMILNSEFKFRAYEKLGIPLEPLVEGLYPSGHIYSTAERLKRQANVPISEFYQFAHPSDLETLK